MILSQAGSIAIDNNVDNHLTSWNVADNAFTADEKVMIRRFLSHSGWINVDGFDGYQSGQTIPTLLQILNGTAPANNPLVIVEAVPGSAYSYSGDGDFFEVAMSETQLAIRIPGTDGGRRMGDGHRKINNSAFDLIII